jgi:hypothetical protein
MKLSTTTSPNAASSVSSMLPFTYPEDMLRRSKTQPPSQSTPPDHLLKLIRKLASKNQTEQQKTTGNKNENNNNNLYKSFPPISMKKPEKTILKKSKQNSNNNTTSESTSDLENTNNNSLNTSITSISTISGSESDTICSDIEENSESSDISPIQRANSTPVKRRSVTFADTAGKPLERVRLISEKREDPPKFLMQNRPSYFSAFSSGYNSTSDLSPTDDEEELDFNWDSDNKKRNLSFISSKKNNSDNVQGLIKLIEALKHKNESSPRNCSYPIDASKILPVHNTNSIDSTYSARITHSAFRKFNPCFAQPAINSALLMQRLSRYNVTLERSTITNSTSRTGKQPQFKFKGTILCKNLDFTKTVKVHYSTDNWESSNDTIAKWRRSNLDGSHDVFEFEQHLQETAKGEIKSVQFCIRYNTSCQEFWDNNDGKNYSFQ